MRDYRAPCGVWNGKKQHFSFYPILNFASETLPLVNLHRKNTKIDDFRAIQLPIRLFVSLVMFGDIWVVF